MEERRTMPLFYVYLCLAPNRLINSAMVRHNTAMEHNVTAGYTTNTRIQFNRTESDNYDLSKTKMMFEIIKEIKWLCLKHDDI